MKKLGKKKPGHVNFRDSKLTRILGPSLSGNARVLIICHINPATEYSAETKNTLDFAERAMCVSTQAETNQTMQMVDTKQTSTSLEKESERKHQLVSTTEKVLEETHANLNNVQCQHDKEAKAMQNLQDELKTMGAKLADVEASQLKTVSQGQEAAARQVRTLQSQVSSLAAQLKQANENVSKSEQKLKHYEGRVEYMQGAIMQSSTNVEARESEIAALKSELAAVKEKSKVSVAKQTKKNGQLQSELDRVRKEMSDSLADARVTKEMSESLDKANMEIKQRNDILRTKEATISELQKKNEQLLNDIENVKIQLQKDVKSKNDEIKDKNQELAQTNALIEESKAATGNEVEKNRQLQLEINRVAKEKEKVVVDALKGKEKTERLSEEIQ